MEIIIDKVATQNEIENVKNILDSKDFFSMYLDYDSVTHLLSADEQKLSKRKRKRIISNLTYLFTIIDHFFTNEKWKEYYDKALVNNFCYTEFKSLGDFLNCIQIDYDYKYMINHINIEGIILTQHNKTKISADFEYLANVVMYIVEEIEEKLNK